MVEPMPVKRTAALARLGPEYPESLLAQFRTLVGSRRAKVVVLDDDPTGTQTLHQVNVVIGCSKDVLCAQLMAPEPVFYILTNSRALPASEAVQLTQQVMGELCEASRHTGVSFSVISRSDSTLRGHFPAETEVCREVLQARMGIEVQGTVIIPAFFAGGRYTFDDIHWVADGELLIPASRTEFARDPAFGYSTAHLPHWVEEKTKRQVAAHQVVSIPLDVVRHKGPAGICHILQGSPAGSVIVANAASQADLDVLAAAFWAMEAEGKHYVYRTAASFVPAYAGVPLRGLLVPGELLGSTTHNGGLVVVGSHVKRTTTQLDQLLKLPQVAGEEISVPLLLKDSTRAGEINRVVAALEGHLRQGLDAVMYTSRAVVTGESGTSYLQIGDTIASALAQIVQRLEACPRFLVAKGGITSSVLATTALGVRVARVLGQVLPGVPVWRLGSETRWPGIPYVVFPGNVGDERALADVVRLLCR